MTSNHDESVNLQTTNQIRHQIRQLSDSDESDGVCLSAYLDLRENHRNAWQILAERCRSTLHSLHGGASAFVEQTLADVEQAFGELDEQTQGLAFFAKPNAGEPQYRVLPLAFAPEERVTLSTRADVVPLLRLTSTHGRFLLVLIRNNAIQVSEIDLGVASLRSWSALPHLVYSDGDRRTSAHAFDDSTSGTGKTLRSIERLLRSSRHLPVIVAGTSGQTAAIRTRFSRVLRSRLIAEIEADDNCTYAGVVDRACRAFSGFRTKTAESLGDRIVRLVDTGRFAVAGVAESLRALHDGTVDTLVMVDDFDTGDRGAKSRRGRAAHQSQDSRDELFRLAVRLNVALELIRPDHGLRDLGGVGCLLRRPAGSGTERIPHGVSRLELVA